MRLFFDTSALIKNYIEEEGSSAVEKLMKETEELFVSFITKIECFSTLSRIRREKKISESAYLEVKKDISYDFKYFTIIDRPLLMERCEEILDRYQLKTLDSIQLSSALAIKGEVDSFISCDKKLLSAAKDESFKVLNPVEMDPRG